MDRHDGVCCQSDLLVAPGSGISVGGGKATRSAPGGFEVVDLICDSTKLQMLSLTLAEALLSLTQRDRLEGCLRGPSRSRLPWGGVRKVPGPGRGGRKRSHQHGDVAPIPGGG